jgi:hypothetical protein
MALILKLSPLGWGEGLQKRSSSNELSTAATEGPSTTANLVSGSSSSSSSSSSSFATMEDRATTERMCEVVAELIADRLTAKVEHL